MDKLREFDVREIGAGRVNIYQLGRFSEEILLVVLTETVPPNVQPRSGSLANNVRNRFAVRVV